MANSNTHEDFEFMLFLPCGFVNLCFLCFAGILERNGLLWRVAGCKAMPPHPLAPTPACAVACQHRHATPQRAKERETRPAGVRSAIVRGGRRIGGKRPSAYNN
jgi:hypothetical protein